MIKIKCKEGVWFKEINHYFLEAARVVYRIYQTYGVVPTVTSACDGDHLPNSFHFEGLAWDFRIWGLPHPNVVANLIREELRKNDFRYDVVFDDPQHLNHIHIEYDTRKESPLST